MVRTYVEQVYGWVRSLMGVTSAGDLCMDRDEGFQRPVQWQPFEPAHSDDPQA